MRVVMVLEDLLVGGAQVHSLDLARRLQARGMEVAMLVLGAEVAPALRRRAPAELTVLAQRGLTRPAEWRRLLEAVAAARPDLLMVVNPVAGCVGAAARGLGRVRAPVVAVFHSTAVRSAAGWVRTGGFLASARLCNALVYVSERQERHWRRRGLRARRVEVIRNGVELAGRARATPEDRAGAKRALRLSPDAPVFGSVAMFRPEKNHRQMLHALHALRRDGVRAELLLVGDGPTRAACEAEAARLGLGAAVRFAGEQAQVAPYLRAMDAGLLCSTAVETLPLFGLELMATGAPLIASRVGALEELVEDGVDGLLFPRGDTGALLRRMRRCLDGDERGRLGEAAFRKAGAFCADVMADRYASLFRDLAGSS